MSEITPDALGDRLEADDDPFVLDIRNEDDYREWHIPGSENIHIRLKAEESRPQLGYYGLESTTSACGWNPQVRSYTRR